MCLMVCPFGIRPDAGNHRIVRCDACAGKETAGCVEACPTGALAQISKPANRISGSFTGHVVVVGSSAAGIGACEAAREFAPDCAITLVAEENSQYSRPLLAYELAGSIQSSMTEWRSNAYLEEELKIRILRGVGAGQLKVAEKVLVLTNGESFKFDRAVIATGARAAAISLAGADLEGVFSFRTEDDLRRMDAFVGPGKSAVVLGGGNIGLQVCEALISRGMKVTVVVSSSYLLSQMADDEVGRRVKELFTSHGARIATGCDAEEILGNGKVQGVRLKDGAQIPADLVAIAKGIRPNVEWLQGSGVRIGKGILIDCSGRTNVPEIFAAGDCAEMPDPATGKTAISGIWPIAYESGRSAGSTAVGVERSAPGALRMNASRFFDVPIISIGEACEQRQEGATACVLVDHASAYRKLVLNGGRLAGALLYGDVSGAGILYRLVRDKVQLGENLSAELEENDEKRVLGAMLPRPEVMA
jgi:NAD(P)H-nitrite reductase large subunit